MERLYLEGKLSQQTNEQDIHFKHFRGNYFRPICTRTTGFIYLLPPPPIHSTLFFCVFELKTYYGVCDLYIFLASYKRNCRLESVNTIGERKEHISLWHTTSLHNMVNFEDHTEKLYRITLFQPCNGGKYLQTAINHIFNHIKGD